MKKILINLSAILFFLSHNAVHADSNLQRGQEIYSQICVTCHGPNLDGDRAQPCRCLLEAWDTSEAIMRSITKGIVGTEMIAYEYVYSEEDRQAVTDFILDKQEGNRQTLRSLYSRIISKVYNVAFLLGGVDSQGSYGKFSLHQTCLRWHSSGTVQVVYKPGSTALRLISRATYLAKWGRDALHRCG